LHLRNPPLCIGDKDAEAFFRFAKLNLEASVLPKASQAGTGPDELAFGQKFLSSQNNNCLKVLAWSADNACETVFGNGNVPSFI